ncbi:hypothetical protein R6Q57_029110 [Mikania cordata]
MVVVLVLVVGNGGGRQRCWWPTIVSNYGGGGGGDGGWVVNGCGGRWLSSTLKDLISGWVRSAPLKSRSSYDTILIYTYGLWSGRSVKPVEVQGGVGFPSLVTLRQPLRTHHQFQPEMMLHGEPFVPDNVPVAIPFQAIYGGEGYHHRDTGEFVAVPFRRPPPSPPKIKRIIRYEPKDVKKEIIAMAKPIGATMSGTKRKAPTPSSSSYVGASGRFCSNETKKIIKEWRCALCGISATCEDDLIGHLAGKKHLAKVEFLKCNNTGGDIGLGIIKNSAKKQTSEVKCLKGSSSIGLSMNPEKKKQTPENKRVLKKVKMSDGGRNGRRKFKLWCNICKTGANDEKVMSEHKRGKKHLKNLRVKARARTRSSGQKSM